MSSKAEEVLYAYLTDVDALDVLAKVGLPEDCITTEEMRPVVAWVLDRYFESGRMKAPSKEAILAEWGDVIEQNEVVVGSDTEIEDNIEWAIDFLKNQHTHKEWQDWIKAAGAQMAQAATGEKVEVLTAQAAELQMLALRMASKENASTFAQGLRDALVSYHSRAEAGRTHEGLTFGLPAIDNHTFGIHTGELATMAAGPKIGKSYFACSVALREHEKGRTCVLYTLENSVPMTIDRLACLACGVNARRWQRGQANEDEVQRVQTYLHERIPQLLQDLHIIQPPPGARDVPSLVRQAQILGADTMLLDQLTFVEAPDTRKPRHEQVRDMTHLLKTMISTGRNQMACLLMHQINREGVKASDKAGRLEMYHMAEGSEVERTSDWVFGLFQNQESRLNGQALFQILAARREDTLAWRMNWLPAQANIFVMREEQLAA